jgi:predicted ATPase
VKTRRVVSTTITRARYDEECRARVEQALGGLDIQSEGGKRQSMLLQAALGVSLGHTNGPVSETAAVWTRVLELAESLADPEYESRALYGLWLTSVRTGGYPSALTIAERFRELAESRGDAAGAVTGDRIVGVALHFLGDQADARAHIERMLDRYVPSLHGSHAVRFGLDQRVGALTHLARILWVQGFPDQALRTAQAGVTEAEIVDHANSLCLALADAAAPIAVLMGDLPGAAQFVELLIDLAERHALKLWHACGVGLRGWISAQRGDAAAGAQLLQRAVDGIQDGLVGVRYTMYLGWLAQALGDAGHLAEGVSAVNEAIQRCERSEERWCFAELLRIRGELALRENGTSSAVAESDFHKALEWARRQRTLSWELRAATSLAQSWRNQGRITEAHELLAPAYDRFSEGFGTPDLVAAKALVDDLCSTLKLD